MHNGKMLLICPYTQIKICKYAQNMHKICSGPRSMSPLHYIHLHAKKSMKYICKIHKICTPHLADDNSILLVDYYCPASL